MRAGSVHNERCPICEYKLHECQCIFSGSAHPDRWRRLRIVQDHLDMLSPKQIGHLVALESYWRISYADEELAAEFDRFEAFIEKEVE